jgi:uncharacterized protein (DUF4213/DUF364 family)
MKVEYLNEVRKIAEVTNYELLISILKDKFETLQNFADSSIKLTYQDSDSMQILITTDDDIIEALS